MPCCQQRWQNCRQLVRPETCRTRRRIWRSFREAHHKLGRLERAQEACIHSHRRIANWLLTDHGRKDRADVRLPRDVPTQRDRPAQAQGSRCVAAVPGETELVVIAGLAVVVVHSETEFPVPVGIAVAGARSETELVVPVGTEAVVRWETALAVLVGIAVVGVRSGTAVVAHVETAASVRQSIGPVAHVETAVSVGQLAEPVPRSQTVVAVPAGIAVLVLEEIAAAESAPESLELRSHPDRCLCQPHARIWTSAAAGLPALGAVVMDEHKAANSLPGHLPNQPAIQLLVAPPAGQISFRKALRWAPPAVLAQPLRLPRPSCVRQI